jgi:hypothetical protein
MDFSILGSTAENLNYIHEDIKKKLNSGKERGPGEQDWIEYRKKQQEKCWRWEITLQTRCRNDN